jgi:outer membrane protein TolC
LLFLIVLSSCSSSKNERVYYIAVADANKAAAPKKAKAAPKESRPKPHKITIRDAVLESLENNRVVLIFIEQEGIARANTALAKSDLLPSFAANLNYERLSEQFENTIGPVKVPLGPQDQWNFAISADFPIYSFGRYLNAYRAAKLAQAGTTADRKAAENDIAEAVTAAAFDYLETKALVEVAMQNAEALSQQLKDARAQQAAGRVTLADVLDAEVEHSNAVRVHERLISLVPVRRKVLNRILARPVDYPTDLDDQRLSTEPTWTLEEIEAQALVARPELESGRMAVASSEKQVKAVRGLLYPELRGNIAFTATDNDFRSPQDLGIFGLDLQIPIWLGGANRARLRRAKREAEQSRIAYADLEAQVQTEVAEAHRDIVEDFKDIAVAQKTVEQSEESLRIQQRKYENGRATNREVLLSTTQLTESRVNLVTSLYAYQVALQRLHRVRGADPRMAPTTGPAPKKTD